MESTGEKLNKQAMPTPKTVYDKGRDAVFAEGVEKLNKQAMPTPKTVYDKDIEMRSLLRVCRVCTVFANVTQRATLITFTVSNNGLID